MTNKIFISILSGFFAGVFVSSFVTFNLSFSLFFALAGVVFVLVSYFKIVPRKPFLLFAIFLIFFSAGVLRFYSKDASQQKHLLDNFVGEEVEVVGVVAREVEHRQSTQRLLIETQTVTLLREEYPAEVKVLVSTELFPEISYGDRVKVAGELARPENFTTEIGKEFDYENYLRKDGIFYTMSFVNVEVLASGEGNALKSGILKLKGRFLESIESIIPVPESSLLSGLLLGVKESLGKDLEQDFIDTGLVHVIVLSGYNVTIIAEAIIKTLSFVSISAGIYIGGFAILLFAVMTGAGATIIRASIMALLALIARATGRPYAITRALLLAAFIMVLHNPYILVFDISFQLSFLATLGLIYLSPVFEKFFRFLPKAFAIREITSATLATQLFVLPFILYKIGNLSLIAPITNLLVLPLIPATMFYGFLTGLFGLVTNFLGAPFGFIAYLLLKFEIGVVELFAKLPFANIEISKFPFVLVLVSYAALTWWMHKWYKKNKEKTI